MAWDLIDLQFEITHGFSYTTCRLNRRAKQILCDEWDEPSWFGRTGMTIPHTIISRGEALVTKPEYSP